MIPEWKSRKIVGDPDLPENRDAEIRYVDPDETDDKSGGTSARAVNATYCTESRD